MAGQLGGFGSLSSPQRTRQWRNPRPPPTPPTLVTPPDELVGSLEAQGIDDGWELSLRDNFDTLNNLGSTMLLDDPVLEADLFSDEHFSVGSQSVHSERGGLAQWQRLPEELDDDNRMALERAMADAFDGGSPRRNSSAASPRHNSTGSSGPAAMAAAAACRTSGRRTASGRNSTSAGASGRSTPLLSGSNHSSRLASGSSSPHTRRGSEGRRSRKEPAREEFDSDEAHVAAWHRWRASRDSNNRSVKRSRDKAKEKERQVATVTGVLADRVGRLNAEIDRTRSLAIRAYAEPWTLSEAEVSEITSWYKTQTGSKSPHRPQPISVPHTKLSLGSI